MSKNFAGQNLNSRSFRRQDLRGADFSECELKGCDFREADLTGAKFCRAIMGGDKLHHNFVKLILVFLLSLLSGMASLLFNFAFIQIVYGVIGKQAIENGLLFSFCVFLSIYVSLKFKNWQIMGVYLLIILITGTILGVLTNERMVGIDTDFHVFY